MSDRFPPGHGRCAAASGCILSACVAAAACRLPEPPAPRLALIEKGASQSFYDADGRLLRLLLDANGDRRADTQVLYRSDGSMQGYEIDTDLDGAVDRREAFRSDGSLESEELDTDGDGRIDRRLHRRTGGELDWIEVERDGAWERRPVRRP